MSTLDNTISMMKKLPETDLLKIQDFTRKLSRRRELEMEDEMIGTFLKPMSRKDFLRDIENAEQEIAAGKYRNAEEVIRGLEGKLSRFAGL